MPVVVDNSATLRVCSNYKGFTLLSLSAKVYSGVLEERLRWIVKPQIQEEQRGIGPGHETADQLYTLSRVTGGYGVSGPLIWADHSLFDQF